MKKKNTFYFKYQVLFGYFVLLISCQSSTTQEVVTEESTTTVKTSLETTTALPFLPQNYVCYQTKTPLNIDGKEDAAWQNAEWSAEFVDIEGDAKPKPHLKTQVKMLWDDTYFYFFAKMEEPHIWAKLTERDAIIYQDDDFEIFIDPDGDGHNYYEFELNAYNTLWELLLLRPYRVDGDPKVLFNWNIPNIKTATHIEGTINNPKDEDKFWTTEWAIPWSALDELAPDIPRNGAQWRVNFSRVDWTMDIVNDKYVKRKDPKTKKKLREDNWVWSPTGKINMHMPERWGFVQFSDKIAGESTVVFQQKPDEQIKWALWQLYFQQLAFHKENGRYSDDLDDFEIPIVENCSFEPKIYTTPSLFEIGAKSCNSDKVWKIYQDGQIK